MGVSSKTEPIRGLSIINDEEFQRIILQELEVLLSVVWDEFSEKFTSEGLFWLFLLPKGLPEDEEFPES